MKPYRGYVRETWQNARMVARLNAREGRWPRETAAETLARVVAQPYILARTTLARCPNCRKVTP